MPKLEPAHGIFYACNIRTDFKFFIEKALNLFTLRIPPHGRKECKGAARNRDKKPTIERNIPITGLLTQNRNRH